jgi:hypothetical protein
MTLELTDDALSVRFSAREKIGALHGDITIPLADIVRAAVDPRPMLSLGRTRRWGLRMRGGYVCRTEGQVWALRDGAPALKLHLRGDGRLRRLTISTPDADALLSRLAA